MSTQSELKRGERVLIRPEWRDGPQATVYVVAAEDEGKGRVDIAPEVWTHGGIRPVETVRVHMVERI